MKGTLYGVGVGPGDPELMTLKAVRMIREMRSSLYLVQTLKKPLPIKLQYRQFRSWKKKNFFQSTCR